MGFVRPGFTDELVGCEAAQSLEATAMVVGVQEELEVGPELVVAAIVVAPDGCLLERSVHPLDPGSGPGQAGSGHSSRGSVAW
jgi:hypothetical protein